MIYTHMQPKEAAFEDGGNAQQTTESFSAQPMKVRNKQLFTITDLATRQKIMLKCMCVVFCS